MRTTYALLALSLSVTVGAVTLSGQGRGQPLAPERTPGVQAQMDPNRVAWVTANCKTPFIPPPAAGRRGAPPPSAQPPVPQTLPLLEYNVPAIPGIIAAGQRWKLLWEGKGNTADGIVGLDDGSLLVPQGDLNTIMRIDKDGKTSIAYTDTYAAGSMAIGPNGRIFVGERSLHMAVWLLAPERKLFANTYKGEPFDCVSTGPLNDEVADYKGGLYMTMNGVFYVNPQGVVSGPWGPRGGNGITLSPDGKTLYVTGRVGSMPGAGLVAFDVQADGSLTNERQFSDLCGDGSTVDGAGRIYCANPPVGGKGDEINVLGTDGKLIGKIPTPRPVISVAFGGPGKKTLFAASNESLGSGFQPRESRVFSIQMIAEGNKKRAK